MTIWGQIARTGHLCLQPSRRTVLLAALLAATRTARAEEIVRESIYNYLIITRDPALVSFRRVENGATVSAIDLRRPERQVIAYTRYLFLPALVTPAPAAVLNIGLGAGAFNRLFNAAFPRSRLVTVEIDPMILAAARDFTGFAEADNNRVEIADGRRFLRRNPAVWDWIVVDAYVRRSQLPPQLTTVEFFQLVRSRLAQGGVLVVNLGGNGELVRRMSMTMTSVFPGSLFWSVTGSDNVVGLASIQPGLLARIGSAQIPDLAAGDVDLAAMAHGPHDTVSIDPSALLTDDFAPTEYLNRQ